MPLEFLDAPQGVDAAATPEPVVEPAAEPAPQAEAPLSDDQPRGLDGKFAPKEPATPPAPEPEPAVTAEPTPAEPVVPPGYVPLAALKELRTELQELKARPPAPPQPVAPIALAEPPDRYADPEAFDAWRDQQFENRLFDERCNNSERFARTQHPAELVDEAKQWAVGKIKSDPLFSAALRGQPDPYGFAVAEYRKDKLFSDFKDDDFAAFQAWKASQGQATPPASPPAAPIPAAVPTITPAPPAPPRSIATAPSAGGPAAVPTGPGQGYDGLFRKG